MNTQNEDRDVFQSHCFDPFPEPQTIPAGWDLSTLLSTPVTDPDMDEVDLADSESNT
jgi:hypothetical protein